MIERLRPGSRRPSSRRWLERQLNDPYVRRARAEGLRSRSAYKLLEIDARHRLLRRGMRVLDLGAAPGGWSQVAARRGAMIVALDLLPIEPIPGVETIQGDFLDPEVQDRVQAALGGPADLVLSDLAAPSTGRRTVDRLRAEGLAEAVLDFALRVLAPGGSALIKLIKGAEAAVQAKARPHFRSLRLIRPPATRKDSSEIYLLARERLEPS